MLHAGYDPLRYRAPGDTHDSIHKVLQPLVQMGDRVRVDEPIACRYMTPDAAVDTVDIDIYRLSERLPSLGERPRVVQPDDAAPIPGAVPQSSKLGTLTIRTAEGPDVPREERFVHLFAYFGDTRLVFRAESCRTGETVMATFTYT